jgi:hypothetical protein
MIRNMANLKVKLDTQKAYEDGRNLVFSPLTEGYFLGSPESYKVNEAGNPNERTAGSIGRVMNFGVYSCQNMADVALNPTGVTKTVAVNGAVLAGSTTVPTDGWASGTDIAVGDYVSIGGWPTKVTAVSGTYSSAATVMTLTVNSALPLGAVDNAVVVAFKPVLVNNASGYASGWNKGIEFDGTGTGYQPVLGQAVDIGGVIYTVIDFPTATSMLLDRSLETTVADNDKIQPLPNGSYSLSLHRNAITAAVRPLPPVAEGTGAKSATVNYNNLTVRATMGYDMLGQNMLVTLDFLMGVQVLDKNLGALLLA